MKSLMILLFATSIAVAQDVNQADVPSAITANFQKEYPKVMNVEWEKTSENYKVEFDEAGMETEIWYNAAGTVVKSEKDIKATDLPKAITNAISAKYAGYTIDDCDMVFQNNKTQYVVELEKLMNDKRVVFDESGKVLSERAD